MCPTCDARRNQAQSEATVQDHMRHANLALSLGIFALIPCIWPVQLGALIVSIRALLRLRKLGIDLGWPRILTGLVLACIGILESLIVISFAVLS